MIDIQFIGRADERVQFLFEHASGSFADLIKRRAWVSGSVAIEYGKAVGWACFSLNNPDIIDLGRKTQPLIIGAYVYPEQRRRGLGKALVDRAISYYGVTAHMPVEIQQSIEIATRLPCLYDPAIMSLISNVKHIRFEPIPEEENSFA